MNGAGASPLRLTLWLLLHRPVALTGALSFALALGGTMATLVWPHGVALPDRLPTGPSPVAVAVDPGASVLYAASRLGEAVLVLDRQTGHPLGTVALDEQPAALAIDTTHHRLYVASNDATLTVVDTRSQAILSTLPVGSQRLPSADLPFQIAADPSTGRAFVPDTAGSEIDVVDGDLTPLPPYAVGRRPVAVAVDAERGRLFVANAADGTLTVLASRTGALIRTVPVGGVPVALAVDPGAGRVYVADYARSLVTLLDAAPLQVIDRVPVGPFPTGVAVNPTTHRAYVTHSESDDVTLLSGATPTAIVMPAIGQRPAALAVDPPLARVYVANQGGDDVAVILDRPGGLPAVLVKGAPPQLPNDCADRCIEAVHAHE